jgi:MYXO-CTERM domain-containing protein
MVFRGTALVAGILALISVPTSAGAGQVVIGEVPAYQWYHGCAPTAGGSVMGYYDLHGYGNLFDASGPDVYLTDNVKDHISSPAHNAKYDPDPDAALPEPEKTSIAGFMQTSVGKGFGITSVNDLDDGIIGYMNYRGYEVDSWWEWWGDFVWDDLVAEIDAGRPMLFNTHPPGGGHIVPVIGYDDRGADGLYYGFYTTWSENETVQWELFRPDSQDYDWGVFGGLFIHPEAVPLPSAAWTGLMLLAGLAVVRRRR